ncbi:USH2A protein, partial [Polypterus senegalus]
MVLKERGGPGVLGILLSSDPTRVAGAVEELVWELHHHKDALMDTLERDPRSKECLQTLCRLLTSTNVRLCSNAVYILGSVAESATMVEQLVSVGSTGYWESWDVLGMLNSLLRWDNPELVMNAAGTIGTLAESSVGRQWILSDRTFEDIVDSVTELLDAANEWTVNNAALVLARLALCDQGCRQLLDHQNSGTVLTKLMALLQVDKVGSGMNAAFALGRLCDSDAGRTCVLGMPEAPAMVTALEAMVCHADSASSKNACFALSCLATNKEGHAYTLQSPTFPELLSSLLHLLQVEDQDATWFAAMVVRVLAEQPSGVLRLRQCGDLEPLLQILAHSPSSQKELLDEVELTLRRLRCLTKPAAPRAQRLSPTSVLLTWDKASPESQLEVTYSLLDRDHLLYCGPDCSFTLLDVQPGRHFSFQLRLSTDGGDVSPLSDASHFTLTTEEEEEEEEEEDEDMQLPSCPQDLRVTGCTTTQVKLSWAPPSRPSRTLRGYQVFRGEKLLEGTSELSCIVGGLAPNTLYEFWVCAISTRGRGAKAGIRARTADTGNHAPSRLTVTVLGRHEILVSWDVPEALLGKLFNYELSMNGRVVYLGTERSYKAHRLTANTEYTFTVSSITSEGRYEARPVTKRTARDEYESTTRCLYASTRPSLQPPGHSALAKEAAAVGDTSEPVTRTRHSGKVPRAQLQLSKGDVRGADNDGGGKARARRLSAQMQRPEGSEWAAQGPEVVTRPGQAAQRWRSPGRDAGGGSAGKKEVSHHKSFNSWLPILPGSHLTYACALQVHMLLLNTVCAYPGKGGNNEDHLGARWPPNEGRRQLPRRASPARGKGTALLEQRTKSETELVQRAPRRKKKEKKEGILWRRDLSFGEHPQGAPSLVGLQLLHSAMESPATLKAASTEPRLQREEPLSTDAPWRLRNLAKDGSQCPPSGLEYRSPSLPRIVPRFPVTQGHKPGSQAVLQDKGCPDMDTSGEEDTATAATAIVEISQQRPGHLCSSYLEPSAMTTPHPAEGARAEHKVPRTNGRPRLS